MYSNSHRGITLIELMVTMAILAVIAAIAIPAYQGYITSSYRSECQNEVAAIRLAEEEFFLENNRYFTGTNASELEYNSSGIYDADNDTVAGLRNCQYRVDSSTPTTTYTITATGTGNNIPSGETVVTFTK